MTNVEPVDAHTRAEIIDLLARHPQLFDNRAWELLPTAYTADATMGSGEAVARLDPSAFTADPDRVYFPHHTTDLALHRVDEDTIRAWSKYLVIRGDGTAGSGDYQDIVVRTPDGWRIAERRVSRGNRPSTDPDGPSTRDLSASTWLRADGASN